MDHYPHNINAGRLELNRVHYCGKMQGHNLYVLGVSWALVMLVGWAIVASLSTATGLIDMSDRIWMSVCIPLISICWGLLYYCSKAKVATSFLPQQYEQLTWLRNVNAITPGEAQQYWEEITSVGYQDRVLTLDLITALFEEKQLQLNKIAVSDTNDNIHQSLRDKIQAVREVTAALEDD